MSLTGSQIDTLISNEYSLITKWQTALDTDAANPQLSYKEGDEEIPNIEWRDGLNKNITDAQARIKELLVLKNGIAPYRISIRHQL